MDVSFLEPVFTSSGPYATVCADVTHTTATADTELDLRVRAVAEKLTEQGAPEAVVEAVRGRLLGGDDGGGAGAWRRRAGGDRRRRPRPRGRSGRGPPRRRALRPRPAAGRLAAPGARRVVAAAGPAAGPQAAARPGPAHRRRHRPGGRGHHRVQRPRHDDRGEGGGGRQLPDP